MTTEVHGVRMDDTKTFGIEIDGIIGVGIPYLVADKFPGLAPALLKATVEWAKERDAATEACVHDWIDIRNSVIQSGSACFKCGKARAENHDQ